MKIIGIVLFIIVIAIVLADRRFPKERVTGATLSGQEKFRHYKLLIIIALAAIAVVVSVFVR